MMPDEEKVNRVKNIFEHYRTSGDWDITNLEYENFCYSIAFLKDDLIEKINKEIHFVVLGTAADGKPTPACTEFLDSEKLKNKRAIVFLTPLFFGLFADRLLHEIAHGLFHHDPKDQEERNKFQSEAEEKVKQWFEDL
jgi:hypothetical protein